MKQIYFEQSAEAISKLSSQLGTLERIATKIVQTNKNGGKILIAGNGGSCADAEHFAGELLCTFKDRNRAPIGAVALAGNSSAITAWSNDFEYESYFARQVKALGNTGDVLFLITTGGGNKKTGASMNLVKAAATAKELGVFVITLSGKSGGILAEESDICVVAPSDETSIIQECHISIIHMVCLYLDDFCGK